MKDINEPGEAIRTVAAACRNASMRGENGEADRIRNRRQAERRLEEILESGPQTL